MIYDLYKKAIVWVAGAEDMSTRIPYNAFTVVVINSSQTNPTAISVTDFDCP